jgi:protein required for attachment to host cells
MKTWIVVASAARARCFELADRHAPLDEIWDLVSPQSTLPRQALQSDRPGRAFNSLGGHRHAMEVEVGAKEAVATRFAKDVGEALQQALNAHRFDALLLVAAPHFLGLLRAQMGSGLQRTVKAELAKDLTRETPERVMDAVREQVRAAT